MSCSDMFGIWVMLTQFPDSQGDKHSSAEWSEATAHTTVNPGDRTNSVVVALHT